MYAACHKKLVSFSFQVRPLKVVGETLNLGASLGPGRINSWGMSSCYSIPELARQRKTLWFKNQRWQLLSFLVLQLEVVKVAHLQLHYLLGQDEEGLSVLVLLQEFLKKVSYVISSCVNHRGSKVLLPKLEMV
jgi:hypothetical protein